MVEVQEISDAFDYAEKIIVYNSDEKTEYPICTIGYSAILESWNKMIEGAHPMPAFGVSIDAETEKEKKKGLWVEFVFKEQMECYGLPFEKLLISVEKSFCGFNLIRYTKEYKYFGRCFYLDLVNKNMSDFYDILLNI